MVVIFPVALTDRLSFSIADLIRARSLTMQTKKLLRMTGSYIICCLWSVQRANATNFVVNCDQNVPNLGCAQFLILGLNSLISSASNFWRLTTIPPDVAICRKIVYASLTR